MSVGIDDLTLGQIKELQKLHAFGGPESSKGLSSMLGEKVIIRTYSAGCWFGVLKEKSADEVIITSARRLWRWHAAKSISLSGVALYGIIDKQSKIAPPVDSVWLSAIEIIPCTAEAIKTLEDATHAEAE